MKASRCSFEKMMTVAAGSWPLAEATSFIQVEYGLDELRACWDGFLHTSDEYDQSFTSFKHICETFAEALSEYIEYLEKPLSEQMG